MKAIDPQHDTFVVCLRIVVTWFLITAAFAIWPSLSPPTRWDRLRDEFYVVALACGIFFFAARNTSVRVPFSIFGAIYGEIAWLEYSGSFTRGRRWIQANYLIEALRCCAYVAGSAASCRLLAMARGWFDRRFEKNSEGRCDQCGYLLYGLTGSRCPECGATILRSQTLTCPTADETE